MRKLAGKFWDMLQYASEEFKFRSCSIKIGPKISKGETRREINMNIKLKYCKILKVLLEMLLLIA